MGLGSYALLIRLVPAVFLFWLAWVVARSPYRTTGNRLLSAFFLVLGLGFFLEFFVDLLRFVAPDTSAALQALAVAAGIADPPILLAFSLAFPTPRPALRSRWLWSLYGTAVAATAVAVFTLGQAGAWALTAYVDLSYLAAFALLLHAYLAERHAFRERQLLFVALGVGFAAVSRAAAVFFEHPTVQDRAHWSLVLWGGLGVAVAATLVLFAAFWAAWRGRMARARPLFLWLLASLVAFSGSHALLYGMGVRSLGFHISNQYFGLRWIVVGGILGYGILRHQLFDFELRTRQAVAFLLSLVAGVLAAFAVGWSIDHDGEATAAARLTALGAGVAATLLCYAAGTWTWRRLHRGDELPARYRQRRIELYQAALEYALADRQWTLGEHLFADTLREVFQISSAEHEQVMRRLAARPPAA